MLIFDNGDAGHCTPPGRANTSREGAISDGDEPTPAERESVAAGVKPPPMANRRIIVSP